jgi:gas vesicle protein
MRNDDERTGGSGFLTGLVTGTVLGSALALLFAAKTGRDLRRDLAEGASDLGQAAKDRWADVAETAAKAVDKGRAAYNETLQEAADSTSKTLDKVKVR